MASDLETEVRKAEEAVTKQGDTVRSLKALIKEGKGQKVRFSLTKESREHMLMRNKGYVGLPWSKAAKIFAAEVNEHLARNVLCTLQADVDAAITALKTLKANLEDKQKQYKETGGDSSKASKEEFRAAVANTLERRLFYIPSFRIYGSVAGFYDYGPPGCAVKQNITQCWRQHFVLEDNMLEVECPAVTPEIVLQASGHVERFTDLMVTDTLTGDCHRADHLLEHALEAVLEDPKNPPSTQQLQEIKEILSRLDELKASELGDQLEKYGVKAPETKNPISQPFPFNLMFKTSIGPRGDSIGFLRPETAQGIFVNFRDLLYFNGGKLPFAAAQIGQSYRNEISPRQGLLRVREFTQAEIEHFCKPDDKKHPKFETVAAQTPLLYSRELQMGEEKKARPMSLGEAVMKGFIANETLGYFIGRTYLFLVRVGINPERLRFRQHLPNEMAHYAEDCWDAEVECSYGWIECVGLADRSAFDLRAHSARSKQDMTARENFPEPRMMEVVTVKPNKPIIGKAFKAKAKEVQSALEELGEEAALCLQADLYSKGTGKLHVGSNFFDVESNMVSITRETKKVSGRSFVPSVVEPSFGLGRIMYCMFEHCYFTREQDKQRAVFGFTPLVAPTKATVFPLIQRPEMNQRAREISQSLTRAGVSNIIDTTGTTIGKRYARTDELGVPFGITVDGQTKEDDTVTLRERDSTKQLRVPAGDLSQLLQRLSNVELQWKDLSYPEVSTASDAS